MEYILAIDQGTTGSRAIIYDKRGKKIAASYHEFKQYFPRPGWVEHDPEEIWQSVYASLQEVLAEVSADSLIAVGITNQRETAIVWDRQTGKPVYNAIVWQCRRTAPACDALKKKKDETDFFRSRTGLPIDAYFSATKLAWILKSIPGVFAKAKKGRLLFGTTDTWVLWKLTNGKIHATDYTNASRTMLFNINRLQWDEDILDKLRIPRVILPAVKPSSGIFGMTGKIGKLTAGIPIAGIAGDQQAALFGQACFAPGQMKNTYGTGAFLLLNTGRKRPDSKYGLITTLACGPKGEPVYALEGAIFIAGAAIQWLRDGIKILGEAGQSQVMARALKDNEGVYFVPALVGLGAPYWDQASRGLISGITRGTTREHLARAALEAMCYQTKDVMEAMERDSGMDIKDLRVDGGAAANDFLCQFQADISGVNVVRPAVIETTSLGAAYLAGLAVGYWKNSDAIKKCWRLERLFKPEMKQAQARKFYKGWQAAVAKTLTV